MAAPYHYPWLSHLDLGVVRSPGPGLGNMLFPIARALVGQHRIGGTFVYPTMRQVKFGPMLRGETDKRTYGNILRSRTMREWRDWAAARVAPSIDEQDTSIDARAARCIVYHGLGDYFLPIAPYAPLVRDWLIANGRFSASLAEPYDIAIHVRMGDFVDQTEDAHEGFNLRQPWAWYRTALDEARRVSGKKQPTIRLFSDVAPVVALREIASTGAVVDTSGNALTAMLNLSKARIIVTSRSSFSMWAAFLGESISIWNGRMDVARYFPFDDRRDISLSL
ncbi:MAG: hypothetical protein V4459_09255 [Pseudomonadota bacterium]